MKIRHVGLAVTIGWLFIHGIANADSIESGTATRVGEPQHFNEAGRGQIKVCGLAVGQTQDLRACTFVLGSTGFDIAIPGGIEDVLAPTRGGKATEVTFQSDQRQRPAQRQRPTLTAKLTRKAAGIEFCMTVDRAVIDAPAGISTEDCVDGETAVLTTAFRLACDDTDVEFEKHATWRVPTNTCPQDFPNLRTHHAKPPSYAEAPCPNPIYPGIVLGPEFTCGYLTVPENRSKPNGRTIRLAVATRRATAPNPKSDPIVFLTGGPGGSGLGEGPGVAREWRRDRDVIFLDQRGALKSDPFLSCPEIDAFMERTVGLSWLASETIEQDAVTTRTCRDRLAAAGADLAAYNTTESSADVADLRIAMGYKEWNIYGVSYGTDLALQTLRDHPAGIRTVAVDAVIPPHVNVLGNGWRAQREVSTAIYDACAAQADCHAAFPDGRAEYIRVINDLAANPRTVHVTHPTTGQDVTVVIDAFKLSYTVQFATLIGRQSRIPLMINDLAVGDGTVAALEVLAGVFPPDFNSYGLQWGVLCREMVGLTDPGRVSAAGKRELPDFPASVTDRPSMFPWAFSDCAQWDVPAAPAKVVKVVTSDVPVLLTSGSFDGTAPPSYAAEQARTLPNSTNLVFPGIGHSASRWAATCFATIFGNFLDQPRDFDHGCLADQTIPKFPTS